MQDVFNQWVGPFTPPPAGGWVNDHIVSGHQLYLFIAGRNRITNSLKAIISTSKCIKTQFKLYNPKIFLEIHPIEVYHLGLITDKSQVPYPAPFVI
jgi:hypothetical protein